MERRLGNGRGRGGAGMVGQAIEQDGDADDQIGDAHDDGKRAHVPAVGTVGGVPGAAVRRKGRKQQEAHANAAGDAAKDRAEMSGMVDADHVRALDGVAAIVIARDEELVLVRVVDAAYDGRPASAHNGGGGAATLHQDDEDNQCNRLPDAVCGQNSHNCRIAILDHFVMGTHSTSAAAINNNGPAIDGSLVVSVRPGKAGPKGVNHAMSS